MTKKEDPKLVYYGPHPCQRCDPKGKKGTLICKAGNGAQADLEFEYKPYELRRNEDNSIMYPNACPEGTVWQRHECPAEGAPHRAIKAVRADIYAEFQKLVGRDMTDEEHASIKKLITEYVDVYRDEISTLLVSREKHNEKCPLSKVKK